MTENKSKIKPLITKSLFIIMILVVIVLLAFAVIRFIPFLFSSFASVGNAIRSPFQSEVEVSISEQDLQTGDNFRIYWQYDDATNGTYSLSFDCAPNLRVFVSNDNRTELNCNRSYPLSSNDSFIDLEAILEKENSYIESAIVISYEDSENSSTGEADFSVTNEASLPVNDLSGSATISSSNPNNNTGSNTPTNNNSNNNTNNTGNQNTQTSGPADLVVTNARAIDDETVIFDVSNIGSRPSGNWYFTYSIPGERVETSPLQISLNPGNAIRYTLTFEDIQSGNTIIAVDPNNLIREVSDSNNIASIFVEGSDSNNSSSNNNYDPDDEADLVIRDLEVGRMDGSRFREDYEIDEDDDAAVRFRVVNIGGEDSGRWRFEIDNIPYDDDDEYRSGRRSSLEPGESTEITIEFENPDEGRYRIEVDIDSDNDVDEEREDNNDDRATLRVER